LWAFGEKQQQELRCFAAELHHSLGEQELAIASTAEILGCCSSLFSLVLQPLGEPAQLLSTLCQAVSVPLSPFSSNSLLVQHALELLPTSIQWNQE
jgi:hypothetical protein